MKTKIAGAFILFLLLTLFSGMYVVDQREQVVITRWSKLVDTETKPGLHWKIPFIDTATAYPNRILEWDGQRGQIPTGDKTYIWVDPFARFRIADLETFYMSVQTLPSAMSRLDGVINPAIRDIIQNTELGDIIRSTNRQLTESGEFSAVTIGRSGVVEKIFENAEPKVAKFGLELVDFDIKRVNYIDSVRVKVYDRMSAERYQAAALITSEGAGDYQDIMGKRDKELAEITSGAKKEAAEIRGAADAEAAAIYAKAYEVDEEFYSFYKMLETYRAAATADAEFIMTTDSELFRLMGGLEG